MTPDRTLTWPQIGHSLDPRKVGVKTKTQYQWCFFDLAFCCIVIQQRNHLSLVKIFDLNSLDQENKLNKKTLRKEDWLTNNLDCTKQCKNYRFFKQKKNDLKSFERTWNVRECFFSKRFVKKLSFLLNKRFYWRNEKKSKQNGSFTNDEITKWKKPNFSILTTVFFTFLRTAVH